MSTLAFIRNMLDLGFSHDDALRAAEAHEAVVGTLTAMQKPRSAGAARQARYEERKRQKASEMTSGLTLPDASDASDVRADISDAPDAVLPLPPSPQTPQPPTPTRVEDSPLPPEGASRRRKPETPLPDGCPSVDLVATMQAEAREVGANVDMVHQAQQFRDWWLSKDGRNRDWDACFRTWARKRIAQAPKTALAAVQQRATPADGADRWRRLVREFKANGYWPTEDAGPPPGRQGCAAPVAILSEFGIKATLTVVASQEHAA